MDGEIIDDIAQALTSGELAQRQRDELRSAVHQAQFGTAMVLPGERLELMSRDQAQELGEDRAMMSQGLGLLSGINGLLA